MQSQRAPAAHTQNIQLLFTLCIQSVPTALAEEDCCCFNSSNEINDLLTDSEFMIVSILILFKMYIGAFKI